MLAEVAPFKVDSEAQRGWRTTTGRLHRRRLHSNDRAVAEELETIPYARAIEEVRERLKHGDVRLFARVNTPWTLLGLEAWLDRNWTGGEGFVLLMPNGINERKRWLASELAFVARYPGVRCIGIEPFSPTTYRIQTAKRAALALTGALALLGRAREELPALAILGPRARDFTALIDLGPQLVLGRRRVVFHMLDEGFGDLPSRRNSAKAIEVNSRTTRGGSAASLVRAEQLLRGALDRAISRRTDERPHYLVSWDDDASKVVFHENIAASYRNVLARYPATPSFSRRGERPLAILLTGCLSEFDTMPLDRELAMWGRVTATLRDAGYDVVLKPHPREAADKFASLRSTPEGEELQFFNGREAAEKVYQHLRPGDALVGLSSNSMLTGHLLYQLPVYTLDDLARGYDAAPWLLEALENYHDAFAHGLAYFRDLESKAAAARELRAISS